MDGMNQVQCNALAQAWVRFSETSNPCNIYSVSPSGGPVKIPYANWDPTAKYPATVWIGSSCPTTCAVKATKLHKNPTKYCGRKATTYKDGGCKLFYDCEIAC